MNTTTTDCRPAPSITGRGAVVPLADGIAAMWARAQILHRQLKLIWNIGDLTNAQLDAVMEPITRLEMTVLTGPIHDRADAFAKLRVSGPSEERGERADGLDRLAYADAVAWLEAHG